MYYADDQGQCCQRGPAGGGCQCGDEPRNTQKPQGPGGWLQWYQYRQQPQQLPMVLRCCDCNNANPCHHHLSSSMICMAVRVHTLHETVRVVGSQIAQASCNVCTVPTRGVFTVVTMQPAHDELPMPIMGALQSTKHDTNQRRSTGITVCERLLAWLLQDDDGELLESRLATTSSSRRTTTTSVPPGQ